MGLNVLLVGCGNMGFAMLGGWIAQGGERNFCVIEPVEALRTRAADVGAIVCSSVSELVDFEPDLIFLAIKPQVMADVVPVYTRFKSAVYVSVAAGVTCSSLRNWLGEGAKIIRTMPNTPAAIGEGMLVSFANERISDSEKMTVNDLLLASGETGWVEEEDLMDAVTAISGSGPAYVFHFVECLEEAAIRLGIAPDLARKLALQTAAGSSLLARQSETAPSVLREQVTSPGGTTAAALNVFMGPLGQLTDRATCAARDRGRELGES